MAKNEFFRPGQDYRDKGKPKDPEDQFMGWINVDGSGMANAPGIRALQYSVPKPFTELPAFLVLVTKKSVHGGSYNPWDDLVDPKQGTVIYWGDAKLHPEKRYTDFRGNRVLKDVWDAVETGRREDLPPILHFVKNRSGWVTFTGLCVLTELSPSRFEEKGQLVENYRCRLRILGSEPVPVAWLHARRRARTPQEALHKAPKLWTAWLQGIKPLPSSVSMDAEAMAVPQVADAARRASEQNFFPEAPTRQPRIIVAAAEIILREMGTPLHVDQIYDAIIHRNLYTFDTPDPVGILSRKIREQTAEGHCATPTFLKVAPNTFALMEWGAGDDGAEDAFQEVVNSLSTGEKIPTVDAPVPPRPVSQYASQRFARDAHVSADALSNAGHSCEAACGIPPFNRSGGNQQPYVEAHHLVPLAASGLFTNSLDVHANVLALCPRCHALVHHAIHSERIPLLERLYESRKERLARAGISVTLTQLLGFYRLKPEHASD